MADEPTDVEQPEPVDPGALSPGWDAPAVDAPVLSLKDRLKQQQDSTGMGAKLEGVRRRTSRPRAPKEAPAPTPIQLIQDKEKERSVKKKRVDNLQDSITGEFNDMLLRFFIAQGLPPLAVYNEGYVPRNTGRDQAKYTDLGAQLAVDEFTAGSIASFIVEFESSDFGSRLTAGATSGPVGLVIKGLVAGAATFGYINGLKKVYDRIEPMMQAQKEYNRRMSQAKRAEQEGNSGLA